MDHIYYCTSVAVTVHYGPYVLLLSNSRRMWATLVTIRRRATLVRPCTRACVCILYTPVHVLPSVARAMQGVWPGQCRGCGQGNAEGVARAMQRVWPGQCRECGQGNAGGSTSLMQIMCECVDLLRRQFQHPLVGMHTQ